MGVRGVEGEEEDFAVDHRTCTAVEDGRGGSWAYHRYQRGLDRDCSDGSGSHVAVVVLAVECRCFHCRGRWGYHCRRAAQRRTYREKTSADRS